MLFEDLIKEKLNEDYLSFLSYALTASRRYKRYTIKKRNGGERVIYHPTRRLKEYQRFIAKHIFLKMPTHSKVFSYKHNTSIKDLVNLHKNNRYLLRIDFKDFFPSIKGRNIREFLETNNQLLEFRLNDKNITLINLIVCKNDKLTIGAPSSPVISNVILFEFDEAMDNLFKGVTYSRYADDLYFSTNTPNLLTLVPKRIKNFLDTYFIDLKINDQKTIFTSKKHKRMILGLTVTTDNNITIGRDKKEELKRLIYKYKKGILTTKEINYLKGYISYLYSIEPSYINVLKRKYSNHTIKELFPIKK